jgi:hypothetical protein
MEGIRVGIDRGSKAGVVEDRVEVGIVVVATRDHEDAHGVRAPGLGLPGRGRRLVRLGENGGCHDDR